MSSVHSQSEGLSLLIHNSQAGGQCYCLYYSILMNTKSYHVPVLSVVVGLVQADMVETENVVRPRAELALLQVSRYDDWVLPRC